MVAPSFLPESLDGGPFTTTDALRLGISRKRLRGRDLVAPRHGVRTRTQPTDVHSLAAAYATRMAPDHVFAGATAARLWGLPVARAWRPSEPLVIGVPVRAGRTRAKGTRVRRFDPTLLVAGEREGLRTLWPAAAVMSMARESSHADLVVLVDALITPSKHYPDVRLPARPYASLTQLTEFADRCRGVHGQAAFRAALADARPGVDSPQETRARLAIVAAGLPEPVVQHEVWVDGVLRSVLDLAYPEWKIDIEYEGEHHLTDPAQWAKDIRRHELLESLGWIVIRVTKGDLQGDAAPLIRRVRAAIARRAAAPV